MSTTTALERIEHWARQNDPAFVALLQPGLTRQEIDTAVSGLPFALAEEVYELYQWRNGQGWGEFHFGLDRSGQYRLIPLEEAVHQWNTYLNESYAILLENNDPSAAATGGWSADVVLLEAGGWLPVLRMDSDFQATLGTQAGTQTSPIAIVPHDDHSDIFYSSLTVMLEYHADIYESGALRTDEKGRDFFDYTTTSTLKRQHFPEKVAQAEEAYQLKCYLPENRVPGTPEHYTDAESAQYHLAGQVVMAGSLQAEVATERYLAWLLGDADLAKKITQTLIHSPYRIMYGSEKHPILVRNFVYSFLP